MNTSELAAKMLEWETCKRKLEGVEQEIRDAVLKIGKTQTVGNVRASFRNPRKVYDYKQAGQQAAQSTIDKHTTPTAPKTDWRRVCQDANFKLASTTTGKPSVSVKLVK